MVIDSDNKRWIKTGDLGRITDEGNIKVIGRIKRMTFIFDSNANTASKVSHDYVESYENGNRDNPKMKVLYKRKVKGNRYD